MFQPNKIIKSLAFIFGVVALSLGLSYAVLAWTEPSVVPPGCVSGTPGCDAPINVSSNTQTKAGSLNLATDAGANVGIGTAIPNSKLETVTEDAVSLDIAATRYSNAQNPKFIGRRAEGTFAAPSAVQSGDFLAVFGGRGYGSTGFSNGTRAYMAVQAYENWTDAAQGAGINFYVTPNGSTSAVPRMGIRQGSTELINQTDSADFAVTRYYSGSDINGATIIGRRARGTLTAPSAVQSGDFLAVFGGRGYGSTGFSATSRAGMYMLAAQDWTDTAQGTYIDFGTTPIDSTTQNSRMRIAADGNVGIGMGAAMPTYLLQLGIDSAGKPNGGSWANSSDIRLKTNIESIGGKLALDKIMRLQGVSFDWINPEEHGGFAGAQGGFIAQDVEKVFPNWISEINPSGKDVSLVGEGDKIKSLSLPFEYDAYLVEAIKEQQKELDQLKAIICADHPENAYCE